MGRRVRDETKLPLIYFPIAHCGLVEKPKNLSDRYSPQNVIVSLTSYNALRIEPVLLFLLDVPGFFWTDLEFS